MDQVQGDVSYIQCVYYDFFNDLEHWHQTPESDITYLNAMGSSFIVLNSLDTADELLDKRSMIYSGRYVPNISVYLMCLIVF